MLLIKYRYQLLAQGKKDPENFYQAVVLSQICSGILAKSSISNQEKQITAICELVGAEGLSERKLELEELKRLMELPGPQYFHTRVFRCYFEQLKKVEGAQDLKDFLKKTLSEVSGEFVTRRSGSREGSMLEEIGGSKFYQRTNEFMKVYFSALHSIVKATSAHQPNG